MFEIKSRDRKAGSLSLAFFSPKFNINYPCIYIGLTGVCGRRWTVPVFFSCKLKAGTCSNEQTCTEPAFLRVKLRMRALELENAEKICTWPVPPSKCGDDDGPSWTMHQASCMGLVLSWSCSTPLVLPSFWLVGTSFMGWKCCCTQQKDGDSIPHTPSL